ncbi:SCO6745 family protein [Williamsia phyllosphaerae]|uniref:SalK n=1 Tax=Williamsia phyllosphaerae TaxID=885042 RepID=A0ABQ1UB57_9NOCA|nr:hypothetical protein [Williamsia phyllosphaerae]GGF12321.1 hypothetical protein GCM10007298_05320 [Williamsia phyllosphaerae]
MTYRFDDQARARARTAYETLEPLHVLAYFNSGLQQAQQDTGLDAYAWYVGARGAPLGECVPSVVSAAFFNFSPSVIHPGWIASKEYGLERVSDRRFRMLDEVLTIALGDRVSDPGLATLADRFYDIAASVPYAGRTLASAWAESAPPEQPHVRLWHATAILREWRGDGHIAALVDAGFDRLEAVVFHEARHPDPSVRKRGLGKKLSQITRGWSDEQWEVAADALASRGLVDRDADGEILSAGGAERYAAIEAVTDDAAAGAWADLDDFDDLMAAAKTYVKPVIDSGMLPGTKKK